MTTGIRRRGATIVLGSALMSVALYGCGNATSTTAASAPAGPSSTIGPTATAAPSRSSAAASSTSAPTSAAPTTAPPAAGACPIAPQTGRLPSDRITDVIISTSGTADLVTFVFGNMSVPEPPQGASEGSLEAAEPPFTEGASGLPIDVGGEHVAQIRFSGMSLMNDVGEPTYDGARDFRPDLTALKTVVSYDMFEGIVGWYLGYDGNGCVTLSSNETSVTVVIDHPA
jgi:hypothetical protein